MAVTAYGLGNSSYAIDRTTAGWAKTSLDLFGKIIDISPRDTPVYTKSGNTKTNSVTVTWQTRDLPTRASNSRIEGFEYTYEEQASPSRLNNTCQIVAKGVELSKSAMAEDRYGVRDNFADQTGYRMAEWKNAVEYDLINGVQATGDSDTARRMDGLLTVISSNASDLAGVTLTETAYIELQKAIWEAGASPSSVLTNSNLRMTIDNYNAYGKVQWENPGDSMKVTNSLMYYHGSFGTVTNMLSRDLQNTDTADLIMVDFDHVSKAWLRPVSMFPVTATGSYRRAMIEGELSLKYDNQKAFAKATSVLTTL